MMTVILTLLMIADISIVILIATACLPARMVMNTMPQDLKEKTKNHPDPPGWKKLIGIIVLIGGIVLYLWIVFYAGYDGIKQGWGFWKIFVRYMIILYGFKLFDIVCLDWWLITKTHFFQHFFPETEGSEGYHSFGFNKKEQLKRIILFPFICAILAGMWVWVG